MPQPITAQDFIDLAGREFNYGTTLPYNEETTAGAAFTQGFIPFAQFIPGIAETGLSNIGEILASQGRTDPAALNFQLSDISRSALGAAQTFQEQLQQQGLGESLLGQAAGAGFQRAAQSDRARLLAQEQQMAEARRRQDIVSLLMPLLAMSLQGGQLKGQLKAIRRQGSKSAFAGQLLSGLAPLLGNISFGGKKKQGGEEGGTSDLLSQLLPIAGGVAGGMFGGPVGFGLGQAAGSFVGNQF